MSKKKKRLVLEGEGMLDDFNAILICAVRYAIGRETYMPGIVQSFVRSVSSALDENTIRVMLRDITEADRVTVIEREHGAPITIDHLGHSTIDRPGWLRFKSWLESLGNNSG